MNMLWSLNLFSVGSTAVRIHFTFFLLLGWLGIASWLQGGPSAAIDSIVFIILLFACVVLHEFGHVYAAKRYGIETPDVTVLPIGGLARLERIPDDPREEAMVAVAGPLVNVAIALVLVILIGARFDLSDMANLEQVSGSLQARLAAANIMLVLFNLIPAFPMDGGRVLRALLATRLGFVKATQVAAAVGQVLAAGFGLLGLFGNPLLILIAVFIFFAATAESRHVEMRELARGFLASDAMVSQFSPLSTAANVDDAAKLLLATTQQEFPVLDGRGQLRGVVTRSQIIESLSAGLGATPVLEIMSRDIPSVGHRACLEGVMKTLSEGKQPIVAVCDEGGRFEGYISNEKFAELVMIHAAKGLPERKKNCEQSG